MSVKTIAIITGASSGLGAEFARQIASSSHEGTLDEVWLIARRKERLADVASALDISAKLLLLDLCHEESFAEIEILLKNSQVQVSHLVNAAGYGKQGLFSEVEDAAFLRTVQLNVVALQRLTKLVSPYLMRGAAVFQISSVSAFLPQPNYAVYAASKALVLSYSRALHREWKSRGITVTCVCPNIMDTDFLVNADMSQETRKIKDLGKESPEKVVRVALRDGAHGRDVSISSVAGRFIRLLAKVCPTSIILFVEKLVGLY